MSVFGALMRVRRLEDAFLHLDSKLDAMSHSISDVRVSQAHLQERMERTMDRTANMPSEASIHKAMNQKLTTPGGVVGIATLIITN